MCFREAQEGAFIGQEVVFKVRVQIFAFVVGNAGLCA
jgi:hypothetical protein